MKYYWCAHKVPIDVIVCITSYYVCISNDCVGVSPLIHQCLCERVVNKNVARLYTL